MSTSSNAPESSTAGSASGSIGSIADEANQTAESVKEEALDFAEQVREAGQVRANAAYDTGSGRVADELGNLGEAVDSAAGALEQQGSPLASYASELASQLETVSSTLENRSLNDVADDTRRLARDNPATFLLGSVVIGIAASRFFKASSSRQNASTKGIDPSSSDVPMTRSEERQPTGETEFSQEHT